AALVVPRLRRELDERDRGVAVDEIGGKRVDAVGHPFERGREAGPVPRVVGGGRREGEAEDDVGGVGGPTSKLSGVGAAAEADDTPPDPRSRPATVMATARVRNAR